MTQEGWTIGRALRGAVELLRGETASPQLDAELLLAAVVKQLREHVLSHPETSLSARHAHTFTSLVRRRAEGVPLAYLTGTVEFYRRRFAVTPAVMVPRPESEAVVDAALTALDTIVELHPIVADIGTGSGVLGCSIAAEAPRVHVVATDQSEAALAVARRNARTHKLGRRMTFIKSDLCTEIPPDRAPHLIVANLPYVPYAELQHARDPTSRLALPTPPSGLRGTGRGAGRLETRGLAFEPPKALDGGPDGLFVFRRFFAQLKRAYPRHPSPYPLHSLILEHSPPQRRRILELAHDVLPMFRPHEMTPFVTSWSRDKRS